jgi:hypothetical protein
MKWGRVLKKGLPINDLTWLRLLNGAKLRLIYINGVLFAVLECRVQQKETPASSRQDIWAELRCGVVPSQGITVEIRTK